MRGNGTVGDGLGVEHPTLSAGGEVSVEGVVAAVRAGAELHRVGAARRGYEWFLLPGPRPVPPLVGEAAAVSVDLVTQDGPAGRVCWVYRSRT